jgi:hypothetical protein
MLTGFDAQRSVTIEEYRSPSQTRQGTSSASLVLK